MRNFGQNRQYAAELLRVNQFQFGHCPPSLKVEVEVAILPANFFCNKIEQCVAEFLMIQHILAHIRGASNP